MIPFFVADRPMSLRIIKGLPLQDYPNASVGIMAHANTSTNFQWALRKYPCENLDYCDAVSGPCKYRDNFAACPARRYILKHTVKMCDSGIFTREGATLTYRELFDVYVRMGVEYGIMIDVFRNKDATLDSALKALEIYGKYKDKFNLVAVAEGESMDEYLACYENLKQMGFKYIAIGGLLRRVEGTVRYAQVRNENFMFQALEQLREMYPSDWLFALGCFHPNRQEKFSELNVWGDYKGWIFQYQKRNQALNENFKMLSDTKLESKFVSYENIEFFKEIEEIFCKRQSIISIQKLINKKLHSGKRSLSPNNSQVVCERA